MIAGLEPCFAAVSLRNSARCNPGSRDTWGLVEASTCTRFVLPKDSFAIKHLHSDSHLGSFQASWVREEGLQEMVRRSRLLKRPSAASTLCTPHSSKSVAECKREQRRLSLSKKETREAAARQKALLGELNGKNGRQRPGRAPVLS
jgi:hypothetical protein